MFYFLFFIISKGTYNNIVDEELDQIVRNAQNCHPGIGLRMLMDYVRSMGLRVQWARVCNSLLRTDPTGVYQRWRESIRRVSTVSEDPLLFGISKGTMS